MKNRKIPNGGYVALLALLVSTVIIILLFLRTDLYTKKTANGGPVQSIPEGLKAIDAAKQAKDMIEKNSQKAAGQIN